MNINIKNLKKQCHLLTQENVDGLKSKYYANGKKIKAGDLLLFVMLIEDDTKEDKLYHLLSINYNDLLSGEYKYINKSLTTKNTSKSDIPVIEGKFTQPKFDDLDD